MAGHGEGRIGEGGERQEIAGLELFRLAVTTGTVRWLSTVAWPWPGICLITGNTPPAEEPSVIACRARTITFSADVE